MEAAGIRTSQTAPGTADLVVVGGGIIGCATAFFAARAGLRVVVVERRSALGTLTTAASTGAFRFQFDNPEEIAVVREGVELFDAFADRTGLDGWDLQLRHQGYLFCSLTDATVERSRRLVSRQREWGLDDVELLSGDDARARWPWLSPNVLGARYRARDGWLDVKRLTAGYATAASNADRIPDAAPGGSATFVTDAAVTAITVAGDRVRGVETSAGPIAAGAVVVAAGPFLAEAAALAGVSIDLAPTTRQKLVIPDLPAIPADAPMTIEEETAAHWRPAFGGCLAIFTDASTAPSEPADPVPVQHAWAFGLLDPRSDHALARVAPFWRDVWADGAAPFHWLIQAGQYEYTPDRRPYLGPIGPQGLYLNGGYSGHGVMAGAGGSRVVVDLITGVADQASNALSPLRTFEAREHDIL
jgi:sarcosine oxidase subunit beta